MSFDARYSLAMKEQSVRQGNSGIPAESLGRLYREREQELVRKSTPWLDAYSGVQGGTNGSERPEQWTEGDSFLCRHLGTTVRYNEVRAYPKNGNIIEKTVGRYSSPLVRSELHKLKHRVMSEQYLMGDVDYVSDSLDLRQTEITELPKLKSVGANLTLDTNSSLEKLPMLREVKGKVSVVAKNREEMNAYLQKLEITDNNNKPTIKIKNGIEFIMRSYI